MRKIKAHILDASCEYDPEYDYEVMPQEFRIGNSRANYWADNAAQQASVFGSIEKPYGFINALGWKVRKRLLAVCMDCIPKSKYDKQAPPPRMTKIEALESRGHIIVDTGKRL